MKSVFNICIFLKDIQSSSSHVPGKLSVHQGKTNKPPYHSLLMADLLTKEENKHLQQQLA